MGRSETCFISGGETLKARLIFKDSVPSSKRTYALPVRYGDKSVYSMNHASLISVSLNTR